MGKQNLDFADDIALLSDEIEQAQELLLRVEKECKKVGLGLNAKKTKSLAYNIRTLSPFTQQMAQHLSGLTTLNISDLGWTTQKRTSASERPLPGRH